MARSAYITVIIPTYRREQILLDTLAGLLSGDRLPAEVIVIDQTLRHEQSVERSLNQLNEEGKIRWLRLTRPSIPHAMNVGLREAKTDFVVFLDDDLVPAKDLIAVFESVVKQRSDERLWCIAGQVLQPGEEEISPEEWPNRWFPFNSNRRQFIRDVMAGNLCVNRDKGLAIGGFDENFVGAAYRFESDFARRVLRSGGKILFEPKASIRHLRISSGGTRFYGSHLTTWRPHHAVGKYYYGLRGGLWEGIRTIMVQPLRAIRTRHHLRRPWYIPVTLTAEILGICWAFMLFMKGPRLAKRHSEPVDGIPSVGHDRLTKLSETDYD